MDKDNKVFLEEYVGKFVSKFASVVRRIKKSLFTEIGSVHQLYSLGLGASCIYLVVQSFAHANNNPSLLIFGNTIMISAFALFSIGFVIEGYQFFAKIKEKSNSIAIITLIAGLLGALVTLLSTLSAYHVINRITGLQPEYFTFSIAILSLMYSPYIISLICAMIIGLYMLLQLIFVLILGFISFIRSLVFVTRTEDSGAGSLKKDLIYFSRLMASGAFLITFSSFGGVYENGNNTMEKFFADIIAHADHFGKSPCANISNNQRTAFLENGGIVVATPQTNAIGWKFEVKECVLNAG